MRGAAAGAGACDPDLLARPLLAHVVGRVVVLVRLASAGAWISIRSRISKPFSRRSRTQSPCERWNSMPRVRAPVDPVQSELRPREPLDRGRPTSGLQRIASVELRRNTSAPPGRSSRAASGIHARDRPRAMRRIPRPEVERVVRERHLLAECLRRARGRSRRSVTAACGLELRRCRVDSDGRAPRAASHAEK